MLHSSGSKTSTANTRKWHGLFVYISEMYDAKRLQLCTHYMITIVQLTRVNCSQARKKLVGKLGNEAGMLFSGGTDCGQSLTHTGKV